MRKIILSSALAIISFAAIGMEQQKPDIQIGNKELLAKYANTDHEFNEHFPTWFGTNVFARKVVNCNGKHGQTYAEAIHLPNCNKYSIDLGFMIDKYKRLGRFGYDKFTKLLFNSLRCKMPEFTDAVNSLYHSQKSEKFKSLVAEFNNILNVYTDSVVDTLQDNEMNALTVFALSIRDALIECAQLLDNRYFSDGLFHVKELNAQCLSEDSREAFLRKTQECMNQINTGIDNLRLAINATEKPKIDYSRTHIGDAEEEKIELPESAQYIEDIIPYANEKLADFMGLYQEMCIIQDKAKATDSTLDLSLYENKVNFAMCALHFGDRIAYMADISRQIKAFQYTLFKELSFTVTGQFEYPNTLMLKYPVVKYTFFETSFPLNSAVRDITYPFDKFLSTNHTTRDILDLDLEINFLYSQYKVLGGQDLPINIIMGDLEQNRIQEIKKFSDADKIGMWWNRKISLDQMKIVLEEQKKKK